MNPGAHLKLGTDSTDLGDQFFPGRSVNGLKTVVKPRGFVIVLVASSGKCGDATVWVTPLNFRHVHVQNVRHHLTKTFSCRKSFVAMVANPPTLGTQLKSDSSL